MSLNDDLILTINFDNLDEADKVMDDMAKKFNKTASSSGKAKSEKKEEIKQEYQLWKANSDRLNIAEKQARYENKKRKMLGLTNKESAVQLAYMKGEEEHYEVVNKDKEENVSISKKENRGMETLIRKYRWFQSFLLVTQNFVGMLGKSVKVFGAAIKLLTIPFILFLNFALMPILPLLVDLSKWLIDLAKGYKEWADENEGLATAIGVGLFGAISALMGLAFIGWLWEVIKKVGTLLTKIPLIGPKFQAAFDMAKTAGLKLKTKLTSYFNAIKTTITNLIKKITGKGGLTESLAGVKTPTTTPTTPAPVVTPTTSPIISTAKTAAMYTTSVGVGLAEVEMGRVISNKLEKEGNPWGAFLTSMLLSPLPGMGLSYKEGMNKLLGSDSNPLYGTIGEMAGVSQSKTTNNYINIDKVEANNSSDFTNSMNSYGYQRGLQSGVY